MASTLDVVVATERLLTHHDREERNRLASPIVAGATALTLEFDPSRLGKASRLGIDWELFQVWEGNARSWTVEGEQEGTVEADHAAGAHVIFDPRFPRYSILSDVNAELDDLSSPLNGLFFVTTLDIVYDSSVDGYDLVAGFLDDVEVSWEPQSSRKDRTFLRRNEFETRRGLDVVDFPSGNAIFFDAGISNGYTVRVRYASAFTHVTTATADVAATSGLPATALDILSVGAAIRQLNPLEPSRNYTTAQGDSRRSEEVPPGAQDRSTRPLRQLRDDRIKAEAARLRRMYPTVMR